MRKVLEKKKLKMGEKWFAFSSPEALHTLADSNRGEQEKKKVHKMTMMMAEKSVRRRISALIYVGC